MKGYDQWKTSNLPEYDYDPVEAAEKELEQVKWALMNWEEKPSENWKIHIDKLIIHCGELIEYIENNI